MARLSVLAALVAAVAVALADPGGTPVACVASGTCDRMAVGPGPIAQPAAAWSSLALGAVAVWTAGRGPQGRIVGAATALSAAGALWYHAALTTWAGRVDAAGVAAVTVALAIAAIVPVERSTGAAALGALAVAVAAATGLAEALSLVAGAAGAGAVLRSVRRRPLPPLLVAIAALGTGAAAWRWGPHAAWHVLAAVAVAALLAHLDGARILRVDDPGGHR
ncbi:MAG: hypothetical protein R3290_00285 [Acidimicrobiia bacterium]|nr:hypothetical protein [Acidimicrobiia bacterium]